jgi:hypothetical protein
MRSNKFATMDVKQLCNQTDNMIVLLIMFNLLLQNASSYKLPWASQRSLESNFMRSLAPLPHPKEIFVITLR